MLKLVIYYNCIIIYYYIYAKQCLCVWYLNCFCLPSCVNVDLYKEIAL